MAEWELGDSGGVGGFGDFVQVRGGRVLLLGAVAEGGAVISTTVVPKLYRMRGVAAGSFVYWSSSSVDTLASEYAEGGVVSDIVVLATPTTT